MSDVHLARERHDGGADVWCGERVGLVAYCDGAATILPREATCEACFREVLKLGREVEMWLRHLRSQSGGCPVLHHANDCDCDGSAGDR